MMCDASLLSTLYFSDIRIKSLFVDIVSSDAGGVQTADD